MDTVAVLQQQVADLTARMEEAERKLVALSRAQPPVQAIASMRISGGMAGGRGRSSEPRTWTSNIGDPV